MAPGGPGAAIGDGGTRLPAAARSVPRPARPVEGESVRSCISIWSIPELAGEDRPVDSALARVKAAGFDGIELAIATHGQLSVATDRAECERIRALAASLGLGLETVASGMSWASCPTDPDPRVRAQAIEQHERALERAAWLGVHALLFVPGAVAIPWMPAFGPVPYDDALRWAQEAVRALIPTAERVGVDLLIENVWNGMLYSPLEFARFVDDAGSARVGAYLDLGNLLGYHQIPEHWVRILGRRVRRVHVKDFKRAVGTLDGFCDLLEGDVPFPAAMRALRAIGYDATLVAELGAQTPERLAKTSVALRRIIAMA
jgi:L-ribulose-5-phosphate 3-epimerase